jgi:myo-inositol-1(or 4)-monophosphatase
MATREDVERIGAALAAAREVLAGIPFGSMAIGAKGGGDPVTEADTAVDACLRALLPRAGEGWLSEESADDPSRLKARRVWIVDPLDGTKEFVAGVPEWAISVGLVEDGEATAGGVCNPAAGATVVGGVGLGLRVEGCPAAELSVTKLRGADVLASRTEVGRGEWARYEGAPFRVVPVGSVAWKLALVAAGQAGATWTLSPKHEWDVAGGVALVRAAGGAVFGLDGQAPRFNRERPRLPGLVACASGLERELRAMLAIE